MIKITKKDVFWSYFAQIFSLISGLVTLPMILKLLSAEEIGMNYLMLSIGALVSLFDFGFTPQFSRNITYIFSGAKMLIKEGVSVVEDGAVNYRLLATMLHTAKLVYRRLAIVVLLTMLCLGSIYIYYVTNGFTNIKNSLLIWILFSLGTFFNIYYAYYASLLIGKGLIMQSKKAMIYTRLVQIILTFLFLYTGLGLIAVVLANLISPFVNRYFSYHYFFTSELKDKIAGYVISKKEKLELFQIVWHNSRKLGLVFLGSYAINKLSIFLAGIYLSLSDIASYGLMIQLFSLLSMVSGMFFGVLEPLFASYRTRGDKKELIKVFAFSMNVYYVTFVFGSFSLLILAPFLLSLINSSVTLPPNSIMILFALVLFLEGNHSNFATLIITNNNVPFVPSALVAGFFIGLGDYISLKYIGSGVIGLVVVQGLVQLVYANWKWPYVVLKELELSFMSFLAIGMNESLRRLRLQFNGNN